MLLCCSVSIAFPPSRMCVCVAVCALSKRKAAIFTILSYPPSTKDITRAAHKWDGGAKQTFHTRRERRGRGNASWRWLASGQVAVWKEEKKDGNKIRKSLKCMQQVVRVCVCGDALHVLFFFLLLSLFSLLISSPPSVIITHPAGSDASDIKKNRSLTWSKYQHQWGTSTEGTPISMHLLGGCSVSMLSRAALADRSAEHTERRWQKERTTCCGAKDFQCAKIA